MSLEAYQQITQSFAMIRSNEKRIYELEHLIFDKKMNQGNFAKLWVKFSQFQAASDSAQNLKCSLTQISQFIAYQKSTFPEFNHYSIPSESLNAISLAIESYRYWLNHHELDESTFEILDVLKLLSFFHWNSGNSGHSMYLEMDDALRQLLEMVIRLIKGIDVHSGRRAEALLDRIGSLLKNRLDVNGKMQKDYQMALQELIEYLRDFNDQSRLSEENVIEQEKLQKKNLDASSLVNREINEILIGKALPREIVRFVEDLWSKYLYITFLREGKDSENWCLALQDMALLVWSIECRNHEELWKIYSESLAAALARLRDGADSIHHDFQDIDAFFQWIDSIHLDILNGNEPQFDNVVELGVDNQDTKEELAISHQKIKVLRVGEWVQMKINNTLVKCKVAYKDLHNQYMLFVNYSGIKVETKTFSELSLMYDTGDLTLIQLTPFYDDMLQEISHQLQLQVLESKTKLSAALKLEVERRKKLLVRKREKEKNEKLQLELEEMTAAKEQLKNRLEQQRIENSRLLEQKKREQQDKLFKDCLRTVESLNAGAMVAFKELDEDGHEMEEFLPLKLGLVMERNGKLVFINRQGRKIKELMPEDMAIFLSNGSAVIKENVISYESSIQSLVINRRQKLRNSFDDSVSG